ncbi:MAG: hypothetical protein RLZZ495_656 [Pseudomonadota bacterium]|jgi:uncharacterized protein YoxC
MENLSSFNFPPDMQKAFIAMMQAQAHTSAALDQLGERVDKLTKQVDRTTTNINKFDERMDKLTQRMDALTERVDRTSATVDRTSATVDRTSATVDRVTKDIEKLYQLYGSSANNRGAEVEEFFYNSLAHEPMIGDMRFNKVLSNHMIGSKGKETELDLVLVNGNSIAVVEVKSRCHLKDLGQLRKHIDFLRDHSPEFNGYQFYGGIAGFSIPSDVVEAAHEQGYFVLKRRGKVVCSDTEGIRAQ